MLACGLTVLAAYLLGSVLGSQLLTALLGGPDIRQLGSGNAGATNAVRQRGVKFGAGVLLLDLLKGVLAVAALPLAAEAVATPLPITLEELAMLCGVAVTAGHIWPLYFSFAGGKGIATLLGVYVWMTPAALLLAVPGFALVLMLSGYVSLAAVSAAVLVVFHVVCIDDVGAWSALGAFSLAMLALVLWTHRGNLQRLARGQEPRFERVMLLRRLTR